MSVVTGPRMAGPRGVVVSALTDRDGSISTVGCTTPLLTMPLAAISATGTLLPVPGPALTKPPAIELAMITAEPLSGLLPRWLGVPVPVSEITPELTKLPPETVGQVKPAGADPTALAQELMPPLTWMPIRPAPAAEIWPALKKLPFSAPSSSTTMESDWVELVDPFWMMPPPPSRMLLVTLEFCCSQKATEVSPWISIDELWVVRPVPTPVRPVSEIGP